MDPTDTSTPQPALKVGSVAAAITAVVLCIAGYVQTHTGLLTLDDVKNVAQALGVVSPLVAAWLIHKLVVPMQKANADANFFMAAGYAQGHVDGKASTRKKRTPPAGE